MAKLAEPICVVDFFAGPGGLGEGFSTFLNPRGQKAFRIGLSVEKDPTARRTLRLRSFFRQFDSRPRVPQAYYDYVAGVRDTPYDHGTKEEWRLADSEAICAALGDASDDRRVKSALSGLDLRDRTWILVGGPPCQAYSLVGRSRNAGNKGYRPEDDDRHFLYRNYLDVLHQMRPAAFVLENVKGVLSSSVLDRPIFPKMLEDLAEPSRALEKGARSSVRYRIYAASTSDCFEAGASAGEIDVRNFVVRGEDHGLGQARHRVILMGVRDDLPQVPAPPIHRLDAVTVGELLRDLPRLRSGLSQGKDDFEFWLGCLRENAKLLVKACARQGLTSLQERLSRIAAAPDGRFPRSRSADGRLPRALKGDACGLLQSLTDSRLEVVLNHEARGHMKTDLARYLFCSAYGAEYDRSPTVKDFPAGLEPEHSSWGTGAFNDRFRVQLEDRAATTITSHISKDGHYFIHFDPYQCRSLTVREAARLQGFPDNYFFEGNRTQQYVQVGNAVPPPLARLIAERVHHLVGD